MNFKFLLKLFTLAIVLIVVSFPSSANDETINSLSKIVVEKPIDNNYQLNLYFNDSFKGNAFLQKRKNGSFYVFIPDTVMDSNNIKVSYKNKAKESDVKIAVEEQPYIKADAKSTYVRLSVDTPVNSDIQLVSQTLPLKEKKTGGSSMSIFSIILAALMAIAAIFCIKIYKTIKSENDNNYSSFSYRLSNTIKGYAFKNSKQNSMYERLTKTDSDVKAISPISKSDFNCFNLPLLKESKREQTPSAIKNNTKNSQTEQKNIQAKISNPIKKTEMDYESELELPSAENMNEPIEKVENEEDNYRPELISELKISGNKGFYLTAVGEQSFALFGYVGEKVFFLQKFNDLTQINLQARFYDNKDGKDLYIIRLDSYKAMLAVSDTEIKELAVI